MAHQLIAQGTGGFRLNLPLH